MDSLIDIVVKNEEELIACQVDAMRFKAKYPLLFEVYKDKLLGMDRWDVEDVIPDTDFLDELALKEEAVLLHFRSGAVIPIYNTELIAFNGVECDGYRILADAAFVYFILSIAGHQAGSLGIWSMATKSWVFTRREDGFCVDAIVRLDELDSFLGTSSWNHPMTPHGGEYFFTINSEGVYAEVELAHFDGFDWGAVRNDDWPTPGNRETLLGYDERQSAIYKVSGVERKAYSFDPRIMTVSQSGV